MVLLSSREEVNKVKIEVIIKISHFYNSIHKAYKYAQNGKPHHTRVDDDIHIVHSRFLIVVVQAVNWVP